MLKEKTTWLLIVIVLCIALIGGLEQKKETVAISTHYDDQNEMVLYK